VAGVFGRLLGLLFELLKSRRPPSDPVGVRSPRLAPPWSRWPGV